MEFNKKISSSKSCSHTWTQMTGYALAPSACLTICVYTFATHEPYSHQFLYFSPSPDIFYRALHSQFLI